MDETPTGGIAASQVEAWADRLNRLDVKGDTRTLVAIINEMYSAAGVFGSDEEGSSDE